MRRLQRRRGVTLLDSMLAAAVGAAMLIPSMAMLRTVMVTHRRVAVERAMLVRSSEILDQVRMSVANPLEFQRACNGVMPSGVDSSRTEQLLPGEICQSQVTLRASDAFADLLRVEISLAHTGTGLPRAAAPVLITTEIARPW